jgi:hypothetical protein
VQQGLDYIFSQATTYPIGIQPAGQPDSDLDGDGVKFVLGGNNGRDIYTTGLVVPAIVAGGAPGSVVTTGALAGQTYAAVVSDTVDYLAYAQNDAPGTDQGGWRYWANYGSSDNSTSQWPVVAMDYASAWGISAPAFVETELDVWIGHIQNPDGGSDYPNTKTWGSNVSRTGTLLLQMDYSDWPSEGAHTAAYNAALNYIDGQWNTYNNATWDGNFGHPYAMWAVYKGLELTIGLGDTTTITPRAQGGAVIDPGDAWNWWEDYCEYLVGTQNADGSWTGYSYWTGPLATAWYVNILAATEIPGPSVPEPATMLLLLPGLLGIGLLNKKRHMK